MQDADETLSEVEQERRSLATQWCLAPCVLLEDELERTALLLQRLHWEAQDE